MSAPKPPRDWPFPTWMGKPLPRPKPARTARAARRQAPPDLPDAPF